MSTRIPSQAETLAWVRSKWPDRTDPVWRAVKLGEEAGEVLGAVIKMDEGRKTLDDLAMETAQVVLCAMALAESAGFDVFDAVEAEWRRVGLVAAPLGATVADGIAAHQEALGDIRAACTIAFDVLAPHARTAASTKTPQ